MIVEVYKNSELLELYVNNTYLVPASFIEKYKLIYSASSLVDIVNVNPKIRKNLTRLHSCKTGTSKYKQIQILCSNGFSLKDFYIVNDCPDVVKDAYLSYSLSSYWSRKKYYVHVVLGSSGKPVCLFSGVGYEDYFDMHMIEVIDKGRGTGTLVIKKIFDFTPEIWGMSLVSAIPFWKKNGAIFRDAVNNSFVLKKSSFYYAIRNRF